MPTGITDTRELTKQLDAAARAAKSLDGELGTIEFDPKDQRSVEEAIHSLENRIDQKLARHLENPLVAHFAAQLKAIYRDQIRFRAQSA